ncbi:MAG: PLP-dependent aminotransferase family protein [Pseudomonadota bacterium]
MWIPDLAGRHGPTYLRIVEAMADAIAAGTLAPDTRLPPYRELAYQLGVSANTTSRAYAEAVRRALLRGEVGRGTFVRAADQGRPSSGHATLQRDQDGPIDLSRNLPLPGFAEPHIRRALAEVAGNDGLAALLDYQTEQDLAPHAEAGALWLRHCGLERAPDEVVATMGGQHGLLCTLIGVLRSGDLLLTEALTYTPVRAMAERLGLQTEAVAMDRDGVLPDAFEALCQRARPAAFYLTPTLQAPTTVTLSEHRRRAIAGIAEAHGVIVIEDDVFAPLKPDRPAPIATHAPDHTVYVTSLSKSVAPGLRIGFLRAPERLVPALRHAINLSVWMTPPLISEIATRLIQDGTAMRLAAEQSAAAAHRQRLARAILGDVDIAADPNGLHVWLRLPGAWRADAFLARCQREGVLVSEGRSFAARAADAPEAIRLCLSHEPDTGRLERGLRSVAQLLRLAPSGSMVEL